MMKHDRQRVAYDDGSGYHYACSKCGLWMGFDDQEGLFANLHADSDITNGKCPGEKLPDEIVIKGFQEFWISPGYGGQIDSSVRRLYGGSTRLSDVERVTQDEFESEYGPCLAIQVTHYGDLEAVTEKYIVYIHEYDGAESLQCLERTPEWFANLS